MKPDQNNTAITQEGEGKIVARRTEIFYKAPLPPAAEFEKYEMVLQGSANRILKLAERQNGHRRFVEKVVILTDSIKSLAGLLAALIIVLAGMYAGVFLIIKNKSTEGFVAIFTPLSIVTAAFLYQNWKKSKDE